MKNLSLVLNGILFAGLIVLYVLFFSQKSQVSTAESAIDSLSTEIPEVEGGIVFVSLDSIYQHYQMAVDLTKNLQDDFSTLDAKLTAKGRQLQKDGQDFQNKVQKQLITRANAEQEQQTLMMRQQQLYEEQQQLQYDLAEKQQVMQNQVLNSIMDYLKSIEAENNFRCVIGTTFGGNVLYSDPELNITKQVINGLNEQYFASQE